MAVLDAATLERFLAALRASEPAFRFGVGEIARAVQVLEMLRAGGRVPEQPARLAAYIAPAVCSSREEQALFRGRFSALLVDGRTNGWADPALAAARAAPGVDPTVPLEPTTNDRAVIGRQRRLSRRVWIGAAVLLLAVAGLTAFALVSLDPGAFTGAGSPIPAVPEPTPPPQHLSDAERVRAGLALLPWLLLAGLLAWREAVQARLARRYTVRRLEEQEVRFGDPHDAHLPQLDAGRALQALQRPLPAPGEVFDAEASIAAAVAEGGRALPRVRTRLRPPDFLLLVRRHGAADHARRVARDLAAQMCRADLAVAVYEAPGAPERLRPRPDLSFAAVPLHPERDGTLGLAEALEAAPDAVVLVFGEGEGLAGGEAAPEGSAAALLAARPARVVLSTRPLAAWGLRERDLEEAGYAVVPADAAGLGALAEWLADRGWAEVGPAGVDILLRNRGAEARALGPYPRLLAAASARFAARAAPPRAQREELLAQLERHLGAEGGAWLGALAVYPVITPDLTRLLGRRLSLERGRVLFTEQRYLALARLPWVARGAMPDWLREALIARLPAELCDRVQEALQELLIRPNAAGGVALRIVRRDDPAWRAIWRALARRVRREPDQWEALHDQVFLSFMSGRRRLAVRAPRPLARLLGRLSPDGAVALATLAAIALSAALLAVPEWILPALPVAVDQAFWQYGLPSLVAWNLFRCTRPDDRVTASEWLIGGCAAVLAAIWPYAGVKSPSDEEVAAAGTALILLSHLGRGLLATDAAGTSRFLRALAPPGPWLPTRRMAAMIAGGLFLALGLTFGLASAGLLTWPWFLSRRSSAETLALLFATVLTTAWVVVAHSPSLLQRHAAPVFGLAMTQMAGLGLLVLIVGRIRLDGDLGTAAVFASAQLAFGLLLLGIVTRFLGGRLRLRPYLLGLAVAGAALAVSVPPRDGAAFLVLSGGAQALMLVLAVWAVAPNATTRHRVAAAAVPPITLGMLMVFAQAVPVLPLSPAFVKAALFGWIGPAFAFAATAVLGRVLSQEANGGAAVLPHHPPGVVTEASLGAVRAESRSLATNASRADGVFRKPKRQYQTASSRDLSDNAISGWRALTKEAEDLSFAVMMLFFTWPVMVMIALAIKLDSPGPSIFRQRRTGLNNRDFFMLKFRTMFHEHADHEVRLQVQEGDPRVTRVGAILRRTSLDELPQIFNVLRGEMSFIGPRPHAPGTRAGGKLFEDVDARYPLRHRVKPGLTGLAQVRGWRGPTDTEEKLVRRLDSDLEYIERWSIWLDLLILLRTTTTVISASIGAISASGVSAVQRLGARVARVTRRCVARVTRR